MNSRILATIGAAAALGLGLFLGFGGSGEVTQGTLVASVAPEMEKGEVVQGAALSLKTKGTWKEGVTTVVPTSFTYQWERCRVSSPNVKVEPECARIIGATNSTFVPRASDAGYSIRETVTAHKGNSAGKSKTGYTVGVEPKYGNLYASDNFWRQKLPASGTQLITEQARYARGLEAEWKNPIVQNGPNTTPFYFVPPGLPTHSSTPCGGLCATHNIKAELESAFTAVPMVPWVTGAKVNPGSIPGNPDKHTTILQMGSGGIQGEWDMWHVEPEKTYELSGTTTSGSKWLLTGAFAKGFEPGIRMVFDFVGSANEPTHTVTIPKPGVVYYVTSSNESEFEVAATPGGTPINVAGTSPEVGKELKTKVGVLNDVRRWGLGGALKNASVYKGGYYEEDKTVPGAWEPSPYNNEMWRWGSTTGGQPRGGGIITYEDFRKIAKNEKIEHAIVTAFAARKERLLNDAASEGAPCIPGSCWSGSMKTDGAAGKAGETIGSAPALACASDPSPCFRPREGMHWRLKESTNCAVKEGGGTATKVAKAICEAMKEYGVVAGDSGGGVQIYSQEAESLIDGTAFTVFNPYTEGPRYFFEGTQKSGETIAKEIPVIGNVEVMKATEYCENSGGGTNLKAVPAGIETAKAAAIKEEASAGCKRPTTIE